MFVLAQTPKRCTTNLAVKPNELECVVKAVTAAGVTHFELNTQDVGDGTWHIKFDEMPFQADALEVLDKAGLIK